MCQGQDLIPRIPRLEECYNLTAIDRLIENFTVWILMEEMLVIVLRD
jgi:hypothetical protein